MLLLKALLLTNHKSNIVCVFVVDLFKLDREEKACFFFVHKCSPLPLKIIVHDVPAQQQQSNKYKRQTLVTAELDNATAHDESICCCHTHTSLFITDEAQHKYKSNICGTSTLYAGPQRFMRDIL